MSIMPTLFKASLGVLSYVSLGSTIRADLRPSDASSVDVVDSSCTFAPDPPECVDRIDKRRPLRPPGSRCP
jgi:hypothetical protein